FCDNSMRNLYRDIPPRLFRSLVDQLKPGTRLGLHGLGEPTLHKDLVELIGYAKGRGLYVYFNPNHTVTTEAQMRVFVEDGVDELQVQSFLNWGKSRLPDEPEEGCALDPAGVERARQRVLEAVARVRRVRVLLPFAADGAADESTASGRCQWPFNATWIT